MAQRFVGPQNLLLTIHQLQPSANGGLFHGLIPIALFGWVSGHDTVIAYAYRC